MELTDLVTVALVVLIVVALGASVTGALNLYTANPRTRGIQLAAVLAVLLLVALAFLAAGLVWAGILLAVAVAAELVHLVRKWRRVA